MINAYSITFYIYLCQLFRYLLLFTLSLCLFFISSARARFPRLRTWVSSITFLFLISANWMRRWMDSLALGYDQAILMMEKPKCIHWYAFCIVRMPSNFIVRVSKV
ncbi:hypothetical protein BU24DRAFT_194292 [Aaosphaeria arxii CBS 175.79]|uniref:Uncharacterized protein n=1 Tax=Aaosphaeria arxii CBS 175.79 TaxID=1450172 RepID=A0A6A5XS17_9PLEO|nr:uncharacterized protein BU24DRAFT_194292 [Aaosphaeria arxii CBS 175.79]KAF2016125.1 hypothetical protein BU24DRAFT_194292 [Aaosphaeria arxii CBS 175.79]